MAAPALSAGLDMDSSIAGQRIASEAQPAHPASIAAMAMILLAGHTQMAFIAAVALFLWLLVLRVPFRRERDEKVAGSLVATLSGWALAVAPFLLAVVIAAYSSCQPWSSRASRTRRWVGLARRRSRSRWHRGISRRRCYRPPWSTSNCLRGLALWASWAWSLLRWAYLVIVSCLKAGPFRR